MRSFHLCHQRNESVKRRRGLRNRPGQLKHYIQRRRHLCYPQNQPQMCFVPQLLIVMWHHGCLQDRVDPRECPREQEKTFLLLNPREDQWKTCRLLSHRENCRRQLLGAFFQWDSTTKGKHPILDHYRHPQSQDLRRGQVHRLSRSLLNKILTVSSRKAISSSSNSTLHTVITAK